ncbi:MAG: SAM-dependent methyltransferase, partial [Nonlabens sp.]|nr:SAM-dependent methyltransferase [Nonlabens sp.]
TEGVAKLQYHYAQTDAIYEEYTGSYAAPDVALMSKEYGWNHALSEVIQSLVDAGLTIELFAEHDGSPYNIFPEMELKEDGLYYLKNGLFPTIFELKASKG